MRTMVWACLLACGFGPRSTEEGKGEENVEISTGRQKQFSCFHGWLCQGGNKGRKGGLELGVWEKLFIRGCYRSGPCIPTRRS